MCERYILFYDRDFEHDVYELIRAFYPGQFLKTVYDEEALPPAAVHFTVRKNGLFYEISYTDQEDSRRVLVQLTGQSGTDALISCIDGNPLAVRKENKDRIKKALYEMLKDLTGIGLPWGSLTGIRPAKLAMTMLEKGKRNADIAAELRDRYNVSIPKAALAVAIANKEKAILSGLDLAHGYSLYVGIPFCPSICLYCSFSSSPLSVWKKRVDEYLEILMKEIRRTALLMQETGRHLDTIYIGGGTPTTLFPHQLTRLMECLENSFGFDDLREFTVEAGRPDSIDQEKLAALRHFPVTRICVNPQTMNDETLRLIGRGHTSEQTKKAFYLAREAGFDDINMDIIIGLPGENLSLVDHTLEEIEKLSPDGLTVHTLAVKRAARLNIFRDQYHELTFESSQEIMDHTLEAARRMHMGPYYLYRQKNMKGNFANVGYAKVDKEGIYNILIMEEKEPVIAVGASGASKLLCPDGQRIERVENVKDVLNYLNRVDEMISRKEEAVRRIYEDERRRVLSRNES